jgi:bacillopeptidase F (M6 metalloprotease family)
MSNDVTVIWKKGEGVMPDKAKYVVDEARGDVLLKTLGFPDDIVNTIRYNADKSVQSVSEYISRIVIESLNPVAETSRAI